MSNRPAHLKTRYREELTPRQREILALMSKGLTNFEIAQRLDISLDGVKYHVSGILDKLNVERREEAAAMWQEHQRLGNRLRRAFNAIIPARLVLPIAAGIAGAAVIGGITAAVLLTRGGDDGTPTDAVGTETPDTTPETPAPSVTPEPGANTEDLPSDGTGAYNYDPELAYVDPDGVVWLVAADGSDRRQLLDGCTGIGSPKSGTLTGGLRWSPTGEWIACWKEDLSVRVARVDGSVQGEPFAAGECQGPIGGPSFPPGARGVACNTANGIEVRSADGAVLQTLPLALDQWAWLPDGSAVVAADGGSRMHWNLVSPEGEPVVTITDAFVGEARQFAISPNGDRIAYPGDDGLTIIDVATGDRRVLDLSNIDVETWTGGADLAWAMDGQLLVITGYPTFAIIDVASGEAALHLDNAVVGGRVSPDGRLLAGLVEGSNSVAIANLEDGSVSVVTGFTYDSSGLGMGLHFAWSGDSERVCWVDLRGGTPSCAGVAELVAEPIAVPVQWRQEELGYGDFDIIFAGLGPNETFVAYASPTSSLAGAPQELHVSAPDGSGDVVIGQALSEWASAWRPDGVWRQ